MDLQGTPIGNFASGTKNTSDPSRYTNPVNEGPGPITNDSLAAESVRRGEKFAENADSQPQDVSGEQSTFNNKDTSGATTLPAAPNARIRDGEGQKDPGQQREKYPEALGGQGDFPGTHLPESGYVGGSTAAKQELGIQGGGREYKTVSTTAVAATGTGARAGADDNDGPRRDTNNAASGSRHYGGEAPNYVLPAVSNLGDKKPKGNNITEGGFDSNDSNNASWNTDIGSKNDPGRLAENKFQRDAVGSRLDAGRPVEKNVGDSQQWYTPLEPDQRA